MTDTDIDIGVGINIVDASLREMAARIRRAVEAIDPKIDIDIDAAKFKKILEGKSTTKIKVDIADFTRQQKSALQNSLKTVFERQQIKQLGFSSGLLKRLNKELRDALDVQVKADKKVSSAARLSDAPGSTSNASQRTFDVAAKKAAEAQEKVADVLGQILIARNKLLDVSTREAAAAEKAAEKITKARDAATNAILRESAKRNSQEGGDDKAIRDRVNAALKRRADTEKKATLGAEAERQIRTKVIAALDRSEKARKSATDAILKEAAKRNSQAGGSDSDDSIRKRVEAELKNRVNAEKRGVSALLQEEQIRKRVFSALEERGRAERVASEAILKNAADRGNLAEGGDSDEAIRARVTSQLQRRAETETRATGALVEEEQIRRRVLAALQQRGRAEQAATDSILREAATRNSLAEGASSDSSIRDRVERELQQRANVEKRATSALVNEEEIRKRVISALSARLVAEQRATNDILSRASDRGNLAEGDGSDDSIRGRVKSELERRATVEARASSALLEEEQIRRRVLSALNQTENAQRVATTALLNEVARRNSQGVAGDDDINARVTRELARKEAAIRGTTLATEEELRSQGILNATLRRQIIEEQKKLISAESNEQKEINNKLKEIRNIIDRESKAFAESTIFARKGADAQRDLSIILRARVDEARRAGQLNRRAGESRGTDRGSKAAGASNSVTFRGADDIVRFGNRLNPQQLARFTSALIRGAKAGESASSSISNFGKSAARTTGIAAALQSRLSSGTTAAFEFGRRIQFAAQRLLEWATPAAFLFRAVGLLQQAVGTIVKLDQEASRLEFFREGGLIQQVIDGNAELSDAFKVSAQNISIFTAVARQSGAEVGSVAEAFVTLSRVGIDVFAGATTESEKASAGLNNELVRSINTLVRLEDGALSAEKAVRSLVAIQRQFQGVLSETPNLEQSSLVNIGAALADAASKTSFNISELADTTTRVGAAFDSIQGTNVASTLKLIADSAKATGATASRTATAFRQFITLAQQNEVALKAFDISIRKVDKSTGKLGRVTLETLLSAYTRFNQVAAQSPAAAEKLVKLLSDRRTQSDFKATSKVIGAQTKEYVKLGKGTTGARIAGEQVEKLFLQEAVEADNLNGRLKALNAQFDEFVQSAGAGEGLRFLTDAGGALVSVLKSIATGAKEAGVVIGALLAFATGKLTTQITAGIAGSLSGLLAGGVKIQITNLLKETSTRIEGINLAEKEGLLTQSKAASLRSRNLLFIQQQAQAQLKLDTAVELENLEKQKTGVTELRLLELTQLRAAAQAEVNALSAQGTQLTQQATAAQSVGTKLFSRNVVSGVGAAAFAAATLFGDNIGSAIGGQDKKVAEGVKGALQGASLGGLIGAQIGSFIFPGIGTAIGGVAGAALGGVSGGLKSVGDEAERIEKDAGQRNRARIAGGKARRAQQLLINNAQEQENNLLKDRASFEKEIIAKQFEIKSLANQIQFAEAGSKEQIALQATLIEKQVALGAVRTKQANEAFQIQARQLVLARSLLNIRLQEQRETQRLGLLQEIAIQNLGKKAKVNIAIDFNRRAAENALQSVLQEIQAQDSELSQIDIQADTGKREEIEKRITTLRAKELGIRIKLQRDGVRLTRQATQIATAAAKKQIGEFKKSAKSVSSELLKVVDVQSQLAVLIRKEGQVAARAIAQSSQVVLQIITAQGIGAESRLRFIEATVARQLTQLRRSSIAADGALSGGQIRAFSTASEINDAVESLLDTINDAAARAGDREFGETRNVFDFELALIREKEREERALFNARIKASRAEIAVRRGIISAEISLLNQKVSAEQAFQRSRADGQKKFGEILLQGPEAFKEAIENLNRARSFFSGIQGLDESSITRIFSRARGAIVRGQVDQLNEVVKGVKTQIETGGPQIIAQIDNERLLDVLLRALDPRITARELGSQLQEERSLAQRRTTAQETIKRRQEELKALARNDTALQRQLLKIATLDKDIALSQRDKLINLARLSLAAQVTSQGQLAAVIARASQFAAALGGGPTGPALPTSPTNPTSPRLPGATPGTFGGSSSSPIIVGGEGLNRIATLLQQLLDCCKSGGKLTKKVAANTSPRTIPVKIETGATPIPTAPIEPRRQTLPVPAPATPSLPIIEPARAPVGQGVIPGLSLPDVVSEIFAAGTRTVSDIVRELGGSLEKEISQIFSKRTGSLGDLGARQTRRPTNLTQLDGLLNDLEDLKEGAKDIKLELDQNTTKFPIGGALQSRNLERTGENGRGGGFVPTLNLKEEDTANISSLLNKQTELRKEQNDIDAKINTVRGKILEFGSKNQDQLRQGVRFAKFQLARQKLRTGLTVKAQGIEKIRNKQELDEAREAGLSAENAKSFVEKQKSRLAQYDELIKSNAKSLEFQKNEVKIAKANLEITKRGQTLGGFSLAEDNATINARLQLAKTVETLEKGRIDSNTALNKKIEEEETLKGLILEQNKRELAFIKEKAELTQSSSRLSQIQIAIDSQRIELGRREIAIQKARVAATEGANFVQPPDNSSRRQDTVAGARSFRGGEEFASFIAEASRSTGTGLNLQSREQIEQKRRIEGIRERTGRAEPRNESRRLEQLQRRDRRQFGGLNDSQAANRFLRDPTTFRQFSNSVSSAINQSSFQQDLRSIAGFAPGSRELSKAQRAGKFRVTGRAAEGVSVQATKELVGDAGFAGLADSIETRGDAVKVLNFVFKLLETQGKTSKEAQKQQKEILQKILEAGLERARKEADARKADGQIRKDAILQEDKGRVGPANIPGRDPISAIPLEGLRNEFVAGGEQIAAAIGAILDEKTNELKSFRIATDATLGFDIEVKINNDTAQQGLAEAIAIAIEDKGLALPQSVIDILIKQVCENARELAKRGIVSPSLIEEICKNNGRGGQ